MSKTSTRVSFGLFALEIKQDSALSVNTDLQPFSKLSDLKTDSATARPYASWEPDYWVLDGQYKFLPDNYTTVHVGLMSMEQSDADGDFATAPVLTVTFQQVHSSDGLALRFSTYTGDYASAITVAYYDSTNTLIRTDDYSPTSPEFSTGDAVTDFKKIVITFHSTSAGNRYLRVTGIDYGDLISFVGSDIREASVIEQVDQLSLTVPFNALELQLHSEAAQFSMINPSGDYARLLERQPLAVYESIDYALLYIGTFYLEEWENTSDTEYQFRALDLLGVLDRIPYRGGMWLGAGIALEDLLEAVLAPVYVPYELDVTLYGVVVRGWLPAGSYRQALQQIGFAVGASITCARSGAVKIFASKIAQSAVADSNITAAEKGLNQTLALKPLVTGVEVTAHNYTANTTTRELFNDSLGAGEFEIVFSQPMHDLSVSGATVTESGVNYAILAVVAPGTVVLSGQEYTDATSITRILTPDLPINTRPNSIEIEKATLVSSVNVAEVAQRVYDYHQQRYLQKMRLIAPYLESGSVVVVDTLYAQQLRGVIEKMDLNLSGGFIVDAEASGVVNT